LVGGAAIAAELSENGFVLRYRPDDGLSGKEGTFLICSFWLASALAIIGELQRARDLMERLLRIASPSVSMQRSTIRKQEGTWETSRKGSPTSGKPRPRRV
jgi:GH15 family glucan-1,4-alpha-glucosidase